MPPRRTLESFFKVTANKKKCTSDPAEGEVLEPSEVTPANADEDATFKIHSSEALVSQSSTPPLTCNEVCCVSPQEKPFQPSTKGLNAKKTRAVHFRKHGIATSPG